MITRLDHQKLGLSQKQSKVYLALVELGKATATELAKETSLKRSTTYLCLEKLKDKGLISQSFSGKTAVFVSENPYQLLSLAEQKRKQAQKRESEIMDLIPLIKQLAKNDSQKVKVKYYEGLESIWTLLADLAKIPGNHYSIGSAQQALKILGSDKFTKRFSDTRAKIGSKSFIITDKLDQPHRSFFSNPAFREIKHLPKKEKITSIVYLAGDKLVIIDFTQPIIASCIDSPQTATLFRFMFKLVWKSL